MESQVHNTDCQKKTARNRATYILGNVVLVLAVLGLLLVGYWVYLSSVRNILKQEVRPDCLVRPNR